MRITFLDEDGDEYVIELSDGEGLLSALQKSRSIAFKHKWYNVGDIIRIACPDEKTEPEVIVSLINKTVMSNQEIL
ncbi:MULTISPECIES: hypothetical protein [Aneurinibacillus]|jgi:hypothetical protein|uniref:Uncharacterized protein n=1 Tax=Aneurinibacillus danicus TaxID=267746 RepID=A0A511V7D2_9BACL|nr:MULTISPECIES: hypothetical protein [Aneurinibacillus]GEN34876.1 hypothetical protein ADA01nite_23360 [Aneurinibacillus danicus]